MANSSPNAFRKHLASGQVIPALPLALEPGGSWSEKHQRALLRYYHDSGAGGLAVGVHSTQFAIRDPAIGLYEPLLRFVAGERAALGDDSGKGFPLIAGVSGKGRTALAEAELAASLGYAAALISPNGWQSDSTQAFLDHCREISNTIPVFGFYLQSAVGGRVFPYDFWCAFLEIENVVAIKAAPFDRYHTLNVARAMMDSGREDVCLYTGNDDNIVSDLLFTFRRKKAECRIPGGLLGHWGVWTSKAVELLGIVKACRDKPGDPEMAHTIEKWNTAVTDSNAAVFDVPNNFRGCIPGILEVLRRQGLVPSNRCLDPGETLSKGQAEELDRIYRQYPFITDDQFVRENLDRWLA